MSRLVVVQLALTETQGCVVGCNMSAGVRTYSLDRRKSKICVVALVCCFLVSSLVFVVVKYNLTWKLSRTVDDELFIDLFG